MCLKNIMFVLKKRYARSQNVFAPAMVVNIVDRKLYCAYCVEQQWVRFGFFALEPNHLYKTKTKPNCL